MGSRLLWRRSATAVGLYSSVALGGLAIVAAARLLGLEDFGLYATLLAALGFFQSLLLLGVFRIAQAPQTGFSAVSSPVRLILLTEQTAGWERGDRRGVVRGVVRYTLAACAVAAVSLPLFLWLMPDLIRIVFGSQYLGATDAARIVLLAAALQLVVGWTKSLPVSIGRPHLRLLTHGAETVVLLALVGTLGVTWGATGAATATLVSTVVFTLLWVLLFARMRAEVAGARAPGSAPGTLLS